MREDLRYLERLMPKNKVPTEHPSDETLAAYIDGKLDETQKNRMLEHLLICDTCSDIVVNTAPHKASIKPLSQSKLQIVNVLMAMAASILFFIFISFPDGSELGIIDLSQGIKNPNYKAPLNDMKAQKKIDADTYLLAIIDKTEMHGVKYYDEAYRLEKEGSYAEARGMYKQAFISIRHNPNEKERIKQKIVINHRLLKLGLKEKQETDVSIEEYKEMLRHDIGIYILQYEAK